MQVRVVGEAQEVLWVKTETGGVTSLCYRRDGTLEKIITALESALHQARGEASQAVDDTRPMVASADDIDALLKRNLLVDVGANNLPDAGGFEERMPFCRCNKPDLVAALPDCYSVSGESGAIDCGLECRNKFLLC